MEYSLLEVQPDTLHVSHKEILPEDDGEILFSDIDILPHKSSSRPQTPYQVLRMLPRDATPAQQDSAIQAWFQPGEIHYSSRPDTLHLPGHSVGRSLKDVNLPQYYRESFFSKDSLLHPELNAGRYGVAGAPVPYALRNDDIITTLLLLCFVMAVIAFANSMRFIARQLKDFFYVPHAESGPMTETSTELRYQFFFVLQSILLVTVTYFFYATHHLAETFVLQSEYELLGILFGVIVAYILGKSLLYSCVNLVFFESKKNEQWMKAFLFITSFEGVLFFPAVMLLVYFDMPIKSVGYYFAFSLIFVKILTFYKSWVIFFRQNGVFLQIILYFCALEIIPLLSLWGGLALIIDKLKVNF